jgi:hypothetical protein
MESHRHFLKLCQLFIFTKGMFGQFNNQKEYFIFKKDPLASYDFIDYDNDPTPLYDETDYNK